VYGAAGSLRAVAFDLERLEVIGPSVPVVPELLTTPAGAADFDVAADGTLVYVRGGLQEPARTLMWVDREGREELIPVPVRAYQYVRISPDGTRVALDVRDQERDIWLWEFARRRFTRFTFDPTLDRFPVWTADGRRLLFTSGRAGARNMFSQASDGTGVPEQLTRNTTSADKAPTSVSPDGAWVILRDGEAQGFDVSRLSLERGHRIEPLLHTSFSEQNGEISPDGRWLAYQSNDSGRAEIWVRPYPNVNGGRWLVSAGGGFQPLWSPDGREIFYRDLTGALIQVEIERGSGWAAATPTKLFGAGQYYFGYGESTGRTYDVSRDGRRFLMIKDVAPDPSSAPTILVVQNWLEELKARVPAK
jgi:eukaryotic-like serine/threonine-protein kinase